MSKLRTIATVAGVASFVACAMPKEAARAPESPASAPAQQQQQPSAAPGYGVRPGTEAPQAGYPAQAQTAPEPPPPPVVPMGKPAPPSPQPTSPGAGAAPSDHRGRAAAIARAGSDLEAAQRELDLAGSECRSACRALASMDRATGHLCELAQSGDETRRCEDARRKLLGAREKVRSTCGSCPGGPSVEPGAPIPSSPR